MPWRSFWQSDALAANLRKATGLGFAHSDAQRLLHWFAHTIQEEVRKSGPRLQARVYKLLSDASPLDSWTKFLRDRLHGAFQVPRHLVSQELVEEYAANFE